MEETEVFVQNAEEDDGDKRENEFGVGVDVPGTKDDACVYDLGVPEHVHGAHGGHTVPVTVSAVVHSKCCVGVTDKNKDGMFGVAVVRRTVDIIYCNER